MKKIKLTSIAAIILALSTNTFAVRNGPYFGLQLGQSNAHNSTATVVTDDLSLIQVSPSNTGFAGRLIIFGYNFNPYAAWEFGWSHFAASTYKVSGDSGNNPAIRQSGFDLVAKGIFPFADTGFDVFAKGGIAIMRSSTSATILTSQNTNGHGSTSTSVRPLLGVGVSYDITQNWVADLSLSHVFSGGNVKSIDFFGVGITYHFVDQYCGQFLC